MKFQGTAGAKKGPEKGPIAAASAAAFWLSSELHICDGFVTAKQGSPSPVVKAKARCSRAR
jgi:hypothetical protein